MDKIAKSCLGIMVVYEPDRAARALQRFVQFVCDNFDDANVCVISNNPNLTAQYAGSNSCGEFSAWAEVLENIDVSRYDLVLFGNDTFDTRRKFSALEEEQFINKISASFARAQPFLVGERCWHIDYRLLRLGQEFLVRWIRTNLFALSSDAVLKLEKVFLDESCLNSKIEIKGDGDFSLSTFMPEVIRNRVEDWLKPKVHTDGWHGTDSASKEVLALKAKCVIQEIYLARRCEQERILLCAIQTPTVREYILSVLYAWQAFMLRAFGKRKWMRW